MKILTKADPGDSIFCIIKKDGYVTVPCPICEATGELYSISGVATKCGSCYGTKKTIAPKNEQPQTQELKVHEINLTTWATGTEITYECIPLDCPVGEEWDQGTGKVEDDIFLTKEEAQDRLKEMEKKDD